MLRLFFVSGLLSDTFSIVSTTDIESLHEQFACLTTGLSETGSDDFIAESFCICFFFLRLTDFVFAAKSF